MSTRQFVFSLAALAAAVAVGIYAALWYFTLGDVLLAVAIAAGSAVVLLLVLAAGRISRGHGRRGAGSSCGSGWMWFGGGDGGGWGGDGGGWGGGDFGGGDFGGDFGGF
jgi:hypothetical protein